MSIFSKTKVFVNEGGEFYRVEGPKHFLDSINAFGGHIIIGDEVEVAATWLGTNQISNNSINGFSIDNMELSENSYLDFNDFPADVKEMRPFWQTVVIMGVISVAAAIFSSFITDKYLLIGMFTMFGELVGAALVYESMIH